MATDLYDLTIPVFIRNLGNLSKFLAKGEAFAAEHGIDQKDLLTTRLYTDMASLTGQVQIASDTAKGCAVRLGGVDNLPMADEEATFDQLYARIARTLDFLKAVAPEAVNGNEAKTVELKTPNRTFEFKGIDYALNFVLPNFFFHVTTAYAILRMKGVPLGKIDYLGGI